MVAVDTNILVRLVTGDDPVQLERAMSLAAAESFYVSLTVVAETEWVLRSRYEYDRATIYAALTSLPDLVPMVYEDEVGVRWALDRYALGGELADYLHIVAARNVGRFATFEKRLAVRAGDDTPTAIETLS